ncbi:Sec31p Ecym_8061 [Eremothecium cymbalariae DBVPG|uniref:Protein transport protein SEC31 n=1 Tax=Eremothecium cymbalariae (strain CBS 270.75 / DBVPG 7215 / KCTC 17166 / NRRL Y-17582) TaxID=931890 RepID=G8JWY3_ERECY|nr:Hypothetical protein Ecym_8061 [Eremothecium cymbalariae DBVPG\
MVKLVEYPRTATFAWSNDKVPLLATGTASGTVDADFSSASTLELWSVLSRDARTPQGMIVADAKFNDLEWSKDGSILAGALDNGVVEFFKPEELRSVAKVKKHTTAVQTLRFNAKQSNVLVSGGSQGEIYVWDTNKIATQGYSPFGPGVAMTPIEEVQSLAWNQTLAHVFASAGSSGFASIWDLKAKKEVIHLSYTSPTSGLKNQLSVVEWHPSNSTKVATATGNDNEPVILVWDLRNSNAPLKVLSQGHSKGILSLDWCQQDDKLMISSGRDNTCILWNPEEAQKLTQFPTRGNWCFKTKFAPEAPDLFASASFDNKVQVQTLQNLANKLDLDETAFKQQESDTEFWNNVSQNESNEKPNVTKLQAPVWYGNKSPAAQWAFGGKLVSISSDGRSVNVTKPYLAGFNKNSSLDEALQTKDFIPIINKRLAQTIDSTNEEDWALLESLSMDGMDTYLKESLTFDGDDTVDFSTETREEDFFSNLTERFDPHGPFELDDSNPAIITSLLKGDLTKAINSTLEHGLLLESLIIALNSEDEELKQKVKNAYFSKYANTSSLARMLYSVSQRQVDDIVDNVHVSQWKHIVSAINTYAKDENKNEFLNRLGDRLLQAGERQNAVTVYLAGNSLEKVASIWLRELPSLEEKFRSQKSTLNEAHIECLTEFVERFTVLSRYVNNTSSTTLTNDELISKFLEFVNLTSFSGDFELALKFLDNLPGDNPQVKTEKQRVLIASGKFGNTSTVRKAKYGSNSSVAPGTSMPIGGLPAPNQLADRVPAYNGAGANAVGQNMQPLMQRQNAYGATTAYPANVLPSNRYAPSSSVSPSTTTPANTHAQLAAPSNSYAPSTNNPYAPSPNLGFIPATPGANNMYDAPHQGRNLSQQAPLSSLDPNSRVLSGQKPYLNKSANNGWNDLPEIVKEKNTRAKAVSTAPMNVAPGQGLQSTGGSATNAVPPPPPLSRVTSATSVVGSLLPPPQRTSRTPSMVQANLNNAAPVNPYAPPATSKNPASPPTNPYAPPSFTPTSSASPYAPPPPPLAHSATTAQPNPYGPPPSTVSAPPKSVPAPPPKSKTRKSASGTGNIDSANELLTSIQKPPNGSAAPSRQPGLSSTPVDPGSIAEEPSVVPPEQQSLIEFLTEELARVTPLVPAEYNKQLKDCNKRLRILFGHIEKQDLLSPPTIEKLHNIVSLLKERNYSAALAVHVDIATNHAQEAGNWLTGVKRLIGLAEATSG